MIFFSTIIVCWILLPLTKTIQKKQGPNKLSDGWKYNSWKWMENLYSVHPLPAADAPQRHFPSEESTERKTVSVLQSARPTVESGLKHPFVATIQTLVSKFILFYFILIEDPTHALWKVVKVWNSEQEKQKIVSDWQPFFSFSLCTMKE